MSCTLSNYSHRHFEYENNGALKEKNSHMINYLVDLAFSKSYSPLIIKIFINKNSRIHSYFERLKTIFSIFRESYRNSDYFPNFPSQHIMSV